MTNETSFDICSDEALVKRYAEGDDKAFNELLLRNKRKVFNYILSQVKDEDQANDIFQDTFIKAITTIRKKGYAEMGKFSAWILRIAHNLVIDSYRRDQSENQISGETTDESGVSVFDTLPYFDQNIEDQLMEKQFFNDIRQMVQQLPESQKEVLRMRIYQDMSFKEIAEATGVSINTALGRMRYALLNLKKIAEERNIKPQLAN